MSDARSVARNRKSDGGSTTASFRDLPVPEVVARLEVSERGLSREETARRLKQYRHDELPQAHRSALIIILVLLEGGVIHVDQIGTRRRVFACRA